MTDRETGVSVVIPTFGREEVLINTVRQLVGMADVAEIIIVDQTTEHQEATRQQLASWNRDGKIRWIEQQPPGTVAAMNRGLREARSEIVLFLDDDIQVDTGLITSHRSMLDKYPETWAIAGRVLQPETGKKAKPSSKNHRSGTLNCDVDFDFASAAEAWVENVMAGNLAVRRERALAIGGFDENFIPPVAYRFETEFAKRIVAAGGKIRYAPGATIHHLRASRGGTRSIGSHLTSASPLHGVGDYYYAMKCGRGWARFRYFVRRPFREVCTKFHLQHPWWIPVKFIGECRAVILAINLYRRSQREL